MLEKVRAYYIDPHNAELTYQDVEISNPESNTIWLDIAPKKGISYIVDSIKNDTHNNPIPLNLSLFYKVLDISNSGTTKVYVHECIYNSAGLAWIKRHLKTNKPNQAKLSSTLNREEISYTMPDHLG